jgi:uncharacterized membrane protein
VKLTETGVSRINGYLFVLERSLRSFLPPEVVRDAVQEIDSHLRERALSSDGSPNEREALEKILGELGPPLRVAQAYSAERTVDEAVATARVVPMLRAVWTLALRTFVGSAIATGLFSAYAAGIAFLAVAALKPIFPNNVGLIGTESGRWSLGAQFPLPPGATVHGGYWIMPLSIVCGVGVLVFAHSATHRYLAAWRKRRRPEL